MDRFAERWTNAQLGRDTKRCTDRRKDRHICTDRWKEDRRSDIRTNTEIGICKDENTVYAE